MKKLKRLLIEILIILILMNIILIKALWQKIFVPNYTLDTILSNNFLTIITKPFLVIELLISEKKSARAFVIFF